MVRIVSDYVRSYRCYIIADVIYTYSFLKNIHRIAKHEYIPTTGPSSLPLHASIFKTHLPNQRTSSMLEFKPWVSLNTPLTSISTASW